MLGEQLDRDVTLQARVERELDGRKKFRGIVITTDNQALALGVGDGERVDIPFEAIVRGNLVDEGQ